MRLLNILLAGILCLNLTSLLGKPVTLNTKGLATPPPRIIRTCCSFGSELKMAVIPVKKVTQISCISNLGPHQYLGSSKEGNGIIYTKHGGFVDMGHLRDQADWTAYLYALIRESQKNGVTIQRLGHEGGTKELNLNIPADLDSTDAILLAGRIAYDLSVWHEIATWYGASYIPFVTERYSSFSIEDAYSNLLGVTLGMEALKSDLPYEQAITQLIAKTLNNLEAVATEADTHAAMESVLNVWWTRDKRLPSGKILLARQIEVYPVVRPLLLPGTANALDAAAFELTVPDQTQAHKSLSDFYQLTIKPSYKVPLHLIFPEEEKHFVTQTDFALLLRQIEKEERAQQLQTNSRIVNWRSGS
ncbi:DUF4056 domain-containing protein [Adhaeribacter radiodurans]|uniref:DUF4056 domain-containing protein n=1 Tax=Adhaeribacter radiodurans TaxID=2745197 RepID=A0A7L7L4A9_9BACT|nr:DUF4056 domain-containing protein [Adhaeribacter radiodurans]QMU27648.1 DUF4056 domain-containing protein [Adhaeribacter radiodurans]